MNDEGKISWTTVLRWGMGALLIWAAISKLANVNEFYGGLLAYRLPFADALQRFVAITLPWLELLTGLLLLTNVWTGAALAWAAMLFVGFTLATGEAWVRGLDISCGCFKLSVFGLDESSGALRTFLESVQFAFFRALLLSIVAFFLLRRHLIAWRKTLEQTPHRRLA